MTEHEFTDKKETVLADIEYLGACRTGVEKDAQLEALIEIRDAAQQAMLEIEKEGEDYGFQVRG